MSSYKVGRDVSNIKKTVDGTQVIGWVLALIIVFLALFFLFRISGVDYLCTDIVAGICV